jgi:hypothetical protein
MVRYAILIGAALAASAAAKPGFETKLIAHASRGDGSVGIELNLTNHTSRDICFENIDDALLKADDGSILGNPHTVDFIRSDKVFVVWANGSSANEQLEINWDGHGLNPADLARFKQVTLHFEAYDCLELFKFHEKAPVLYKRDLTATPTFWDQGADR